MKTTYKSILCAIALSALAAITPSAMAAPDPVLVLCADVNVFDMSGHAVAQGDKVHYWLDARGLGHRWFYAVGPKSHLHEPKLITSGGRPWLEFDGHDQWLTLGNMFDKDGVAQKIGPAKTLLVVIRKKTSPWRFRDPMCPLYPPVAPNNPHVVCIQNSATPYSLYQRKLNPTETIVGDQAFSEFAQFGLDKTNFWLFCSARAISYRWSYLNLPGPADHSKTPCELSPTGTLMYGTNTFAATGTKNAADGSTHVLAVTHELGSKSSHDTVRLFYDVNEIFETNTPGGSGFGMTCIGGGYYHAEDYSGVTTLVAPSGKSLAGQEEPENFLHAARCFGGDIAAVVVYDKALKPDEVKKLSRYMLKDPCLPWRSEVRPVSHFPPSL
jgi:hypothetical protein